MPDLALIARLVLTWCMRRAPASIPRATVRKRCLETGGVQMRVIVNVLALGALIAPLAACESSRSTDIRVFTGRRVEIGYREDGSAYRRITFDRCDRPDQIRLGSPTDQLLELAFMLPDGSVEEVDQPTLRRIERDEVQIRIFEDRVEYAEPDAPMPSAPLYGMSPPSGAPYVAPEAPPCPARP